MTDQIQIQLLVERIVLFNDQEAYKKIFFLFYKDLNRFAFSFVKSKEVAEEISSDVFLNLWKNRSRLLEIGNLKVYLYVAVKNLSIKHLSRSGKDNHISLDNLSVELKFHDASLTPEDLLISREMAIKIESAVRSLPPRCKIIYKLIREDGLKYKEVAGILNISVKTIDAQMCIATRKICQSVNYTLDKNLRK
jgi:RNA polymerase sigma-19 factor, ECF subfamily